MAFDGGLAAAGDEDGGGGVVAVIVGLLWTATILTRAPKLITGGRGSVGPRLQKGELSAGQASEKAIEAYWGAERAAARGDCRKAAGFWQRAERQLAQVERRTAIGDRSAVPIKDQIRAARKAMRHGKCPIK